MLFIIATLKEREGKKWVNRGYKIIDSETGKYRLLSEETVRKEKLVLANAEFKDGQLVGTQGDLDRYTKLNVYDGEVIGPCRIVILGLDTEGNYLCVTGAYQESYLIRPLSKSMLKRTIWNFLVDDSSPVANAKVMDSQNFKTLSIKPIKGSFEIIKKSYKFIQKDFDFGNKAGSYTSKWMVRIVRRGEPYGKEYSMINTGKPLVEFYDLEQDKDSFPIGQFVSSYYVDTLLDGNSGLDLMGYVDKWKINSNCMKEVRDWISSLNLKLI